jgi:hypothetical protein
VPSYLVEAYLPRDAAPEPRLRRWRTRGVPIRYVRTTYLPDDETCFHVFEAASSDIVEAAGRRTEPGRARVVPTVETSRPARRRAK